MANQVPELLSKWIERTRKFKSVGIQTDSVWSDLSTRVGVSTFPPMYTLGEL